MTEMDQMSLFGNEPELGSWAPRTGLPLTFRQTCEKVGERVLLNCSTASMPCWQVVLVEGTSLDPETHETVLILTDGKRKKYLRKYAWTASGKRRLPVYALEKEENNE